MKDESPLGSLTIPELKQAFVDIQGDLKGQKIDILGFDSCLMSMAEVCYELKGLVDIAVGSEGYSPASGWPYCEMLERLAREADDAASSQPTADNAALVRKRIARDSLTSTSTTTPTTGGRSVVAQSGARRKQGRGSENPH